MHQLRQSVSTRGIEIRNAPLASLGTETVNTEKIKQVLKLSKYNLSSSLVIVTFRINDVKRERAHIEVPS